MACSCGQATPGCDLAHLAGLAPASVICEILNEDGSMARLPDLVEFAAKHQLKIGAIADLIHADFGTALSRKPGRAGLDRLLDERGVDLVTFRDWQKIEAAEAERARDGSPREKFTHVEEMLQALGLSRTT